MKFTPTDFKDIINSDGYILRVMKSDLQESNISYFLEGRCFNGQTFIYTPLNKTAIKLYFEDRITLKELFMLGRTHEFYLREDKTEALVTTYLLSDDNIFETIQCGKELYSQIPKGMGLENPLEDFSSLI
ncbi:MAG: hypothetical protein WCK78_13030 [Paludibacter sp.]